MARGTIKNVSMVQTPDKEQSNNWAFPVEQRELANPFDASQKTGVFGVFRRDTNAYIGQYRGLKVLPYSSIVDTFETALTDGGVQFNRSLMTTGNGSRFWGRYEITGGVKIAGEGFSQVLRLQSSHDGSLTPGFSLEMMRLMCLNGAMGLAEVFALFSKHKEEFDLGFITGNVMSAIEDGTAHATQSIEKMGNIALNDGQARNVVSNIVTLGSLKGVSPKTGHLIYNNWRNPSADEKPLGDTMYRLFNATTRLTRDIESAGRFEMSRKANVFVTGAFDLATRRDTDLAKLLGTPKTPLDFDNVTVNN